VFVRFAANCHALPHTSPHQETPCPPSSCMQTALEEVFKLLDTDSSGYLDAHKFRRMGRAQGGADCSLVQAKMEISKVGG
jgi:hypothetical protein